MKMVQALTIAALTTMISSVSYAGNLGVKCFAGLKPASTAAAIVSFEIANNASNRLISDINESRSTTDSETLPSFLVSQYKYQPLELLVEVDDGSPDGNPIAKLQAVLAPKKAGEKARYVGVYKRLDLGRQLSSLVTCTVVEQL